MRTTPSSRGCRSGIRARPEHRVVCPNSPANASGALDQLVIQNQATCRSPQTTVSGDQISQTPAAWRPNQTSAKAQEFAAFSSSTRKPVAFSMGPLRSKLLQARLARILNAETRGSTRPRQADPDSFARNVRLHLDQFTKTRNQIIDEDLRIARCGHRLLGRELRVNIRKR